eukprot:CAMPEP_0181036572 /NCGR_PEP_ID=MMETSP1070-20121207/8934_1 /TAXON_ID=265543 /ORGANISM="Minutocellus polymorphus, Strain NH13" /LENGTH=328 /DNA_ID=CAMNT_0023114219 /DNA_START=66 /DNA_END=1052 /DNA_ORIENTATION=+
MRSIGTTTHWRRAGVLFAIFAAAVLCAVTTPRSAVTTPRKTSVAGAEYSRETNEVAPNGCKRLGLPQPATSIPLSPGAYEMDRGVISNFVMGVLDKDIHPPLHIALPRFFSDRINDKTGRFANAGNSDHTYQRAASSKAEDGIFIDVGGWVGDSSLPSAALGIDTYVFEPVRSNANHIHYSLLANDCSVSEHLTIVNALVGDKNSASESVYVTSLRGDNAAANKNQATMNVGESGGDFEQPVEMITLDSFFPAGTKVQNLKIDVQGFELHVLRGAERVLRENKGILHLRFEYTEKLLKAAGTNPQDIFDFMGGIGYQVIKSGGDVDMM